MTDRNRLAVAAALGAMVITPLALLMGARWLFVAAVVSAAVWWTWHGALEWCGRQDDDRMEGRA